MVSGFLKASDHVSELNIDFVKHLKFQRAVIYKNM